MFMCGVDGSVRVIRLFFYNLKDYYPSNFVPLMPAAGRLCSSAGRLAME